MSISNVTDARADRLRRWAQESLALAIDALNRDDPQVARNAIIDALHNVDRSMEKD